jgi:flagellar protein FliO/FliZ
MTFDTGLQFFIALCVVLALMGLLAIILKKINTMQSGLTGKSNRLKIVEQRMIDPKTKTAIIRCDDKDHLVLISQNGNTVIKADITPPKEPLKKDIPVETL